MDIERLGNTIEAWFWLAFSLIFFIPAVRPKEKHRLFCVTTGLLLVIFGCSDFVEARTGAWWRPWWLLAWKAACNLGFALMAFWFFKITPDWRQKVLGKKPENHS